MKSLLFNLLVLSFLMTANSLYPQYREVGTIGYNRCLGGLTNSGINCVTVPSHDEFYMTNGTIEAWIFCSNSNGGIIVRKDHLDGSYESYTFGINNSNHLTFWFTSTSYHYSNTDGVTIPVHSWTHVAVSWVQNSTNNYTLTWFVNGIPSGTSQTVTGSMWQHHSSLAIGNDDTYGNSVFPGYIDEVRFWNRALTAGELAEKRFTSIGDKGGANTGGSINGSSSYNGLFASYTFNYKASNIFEDISGFNGTYLGTAYSSACLPGLPIPYNNVLYVPNSTTMDYVKIPDNTVLTGTPGTIEAWVYLTSSSSYKQTVAIKGIPSNPALSFWFFIDATTNKLGFSVGGSTVISTGEGIPLYAWTHIAVSYRVPPSSIPRVDFYVNSIFNGTGTISNSMPVNTEEVQVGNSTAYNNCIHGYIDELRFWGNKRDVDSLKAYMYASSKSIQNGWLKAAYPFDGNVCNYTSNSGLNGSLKNNARFSGYLNEVTPGIITSTFVSHPTNLNYQLFDSTIVPGVFPQRFRFSAPNKTIPDLTPVYDSIIINDATGNVTNVEVFLAIRHLYISDIQAVVIAPNGTQKTILNGGNGGTGKHLLTIFKDEFLYGTNGSTNYMPPWSVFLKPDNLMGNFGNSPANGLWRIKLTDAVTGDIGNLMEWGLMIKTTTDIHNLSNKIPAEYKLNQNYPNPFNPSTNIGFQVKESKFVTIKVFDALGKEIKTLVSENMKPGEYEVNFDGSNLSTGIYLLRMQAGNFTEARKMVLIK